MPTSRCLSVLAMSTKLAAAVFASAALFASATETEHTSFRIFRAPGPVVVDGETGDWDLSGSMLVCSDVEEYRDEFASWQSAMFDDENLYLLSRWNDATPLNNPGLCGSDAGFAGDCLQVRLILDSTGAAKRDRQPTERCCHVDAWRGRDGRDMIGIVYGRGFDEGSVKNALSEGARQAFRIRPDGKGYVQEMSIPWRLLAPEGYVPKAGDTLVMTYEPNFGTSSNMRITTKDLFREGVVPDRVFAFMASPTWGEVTLEDRPPAEPSRVRLSDTRTFRVTMDGGVPAVDWTGLFKDNRPEGFVKIPLSLEEDGFVSLNVRNAEGEVVRHLLNAEFLPRGEHEILWDGLTTPNDRQVGAPVPAGTYSWDAIVRKALDMTLVGWAANAGSAPYDCPGGNWGGDQGNPTAVFAAGDRVYLGWTGSEAGQALVCADCDGNVVWRQKRGGFGGASHVVADGDDVYVYDYIQDGMLYRLDAATGQYRNFDGSDTALLSVRDALEGHYSEEAIDYEKRTKHRCALGGLGLAGGRLFLAFGNRNRPWSEEQPGGDVVVALDRRTGAKVGEIAVRDPRDLKNGADGRLYVLHGREVGVVDPSAMAIEPLLADVGEGAACVAADAEGTVYVGYGEPFNAVRAFDREGRVLRTVGKEGGRALVGPWDREGMRFVTALAVDARGALWAAEFDDKPRRFSRWDAKGGGLEKEFFGPTHYGAGGGAICPVDPHTVCGLNCEWRIDPATGRSECVAVVTRGHWANARFGQSPDGRVYLVVGGGWGGPFRPSEIYERLAPGRWALRTRLTPKQEGWNVVGCTVWSDRNGDEREQADEVRAYDIDLGGWIDGWYMPCNQDLGFGGGAYYVRVTGWTPCGAPEYDLSKAVRLPEAAVEDGRNRGGMGAQRNIVSEDGRYVIYNGHYGAHHSDMPCYDVATGRRVFAYPNTYVGVHGGHSAPPARQGLVRAAYDFVGTLKLPGAAGNLFFVGTDKGEWHILNDRGFYVGALFEGDPMKVRWPEAAVPGANLNRIPPGMGAEDFGGSVIRTTDGKVYLQAGKTAFIDIRLDGLDTIRDLASGTIEFSEADVVRAGEFQAGYLAAVDSGKRCAFPLREVAFTGDPAKDFDGVEGVSFGPDGARVRAWAALGAERLRLAWDVQDRTPWKNGARGAANMYATGDTVDFQLGADASADPRRADPVKGDFRLSIGSVGGAPKAVVYRKVSDEKRPMRFFSGVWRDGVEFDFVGEVEADVRVAERAGGYVVEASVPLAALGVDAKAQKLRGDFGATFGNDAADDTVLRAHWSNQATGLVADEVAELLFRPALWGDVEFK